MSHPCPMLAMFAEPLIGRVLDMLGDWRSVSSCQHRLLAIVEEMTILNMGLLKLDSGL
jgi:hypothetical protein